MSANEALVSIIIPVVFMVTVAGVILLRPLTRPLARYLDALTRAQEGGGPSQELELLQDRLGGLESRLTLLEERQNFTDALLSSGTRPDPAALRLASARHQSLASQSLDSQAADPRWAPAGAAPEGTEPG